MELSRTLQEDLEGLAREFMDSRTGRPVYPLWHRTCRDVAYFYVIPVAPGMPIESRYARDFNGDTPEAGSPLRCCSCSQPIKPYDITQSRPPA